MDSFAVPQFLRVPANHELFAELQSRVADTWKGRSRRVPRVAKVFLITWPKDMRRSFQDYRDAVARNRRIQAGQPTECKCFAGERRACRLGDAGVPSLCVDTHCALCRAVGSGFASTLAWNRNAMPVASLPFGGGIYVSPNSNTAFDVAEDEEPGSPYTALLVTRTVLGEKLVLHREERGREAADMSYDSIKGFPVGSKQAQFVVYDANAVRPAYLVMMEKV
ncbi:hypothetical protein AURDEDRAFT_77957 [Auricularia subglabra TFB-10046 SS5]|nr:hypothetical protein AURDEDRAFT_77957 [Auricularia subglabra TFB-10046 SS5]